MKKHFILAAAAAFAMVACAKVETIQNTVEANAISFGVYVPQATKAGAAGTITTAGADETTSLQTTGFGVFATYSNGGDYAATTGPNFMYNTKVSGASWSYSPIKYWPNETINDYHSAIAPAAADKLSFFAYAPHVGYVNDEDHGNDFTGSTSEGITALTAKNATTDPMVTYKVSTTPETAVDLLWAVAPAGGFSYTDVHNATVSVAEGMPLKNLTKPNTTKAMSFRFRHATARLGLKIQGAFDQVAAGGTLQDGTKVTVKQIQLVDVPVYTQGDLNLNNTTPNTPLWQSLSGPTNTTFTVQGANLNATIKDSGTDDIQSVEGVTNEAKNVFANDKTFFTLIPVDDPTTIRVKITYDVTTADNGLSVGFSRVENVIYKDIVFGEDNEEPTPDVPAFEAGKAYTIKIILGMTSVKLEAEVEPWGNGEDKSVDLPVNTAGA